MIFKSEDKQYKVYWFHKTPNYVLNQIHKFDRHLNSGTLCCIQELRNKEACTYSGFSKLHPKDQYKKTTGRFISFHCALFNFLCEFPEEKRAIWQDQLPHIFNLILEQYQAQMPNDFQESNLTLIMNMTVNYTRNPWLYAR